jgi:DNA-binding NtrC family response regulator
MLENALSASGYKVLSAQNGLECVEIYMAHSQHIDLIILDMSMTVMSGDEAFKKIRNINPKCKVIIASGYDSNSASIKLESVGISDVLEKPFKLEALYSTVRKVLAS